MRNVWVPLNLCFAESDEPKKTNITKIFWGPYYQGVQKLDHRLLLFAWLID